MPKQAQLDHAVINVGFDMDQAAQIFSNLGFHLTERGYHSLGSINHLMMFGTDYLELIGLPAESKGSPAGRPDIANAPPGLNGLVFKTDSAQGNLDILETLGIAAGPTKSFTRPVSLPDGEVEASFTTTHVKGGTFPGGRVYFCEHHTPDVVWRPEWQDHANGAQAITDFVIASTSPDQEAGKFSALLETEIKQDGEVRTLVMDGATLTILSPEAYGARFGALACSLNGRASIFGALKIRTRSLDAVRQVLTELKTPLPMEDNQTRILIHEPTFDSLFEFTE
ncbi:VOC family protein [Sneathiella marina]|uniref:VOC family protein n=1 Tax=Sneathiella marina TaxID=2950108 RepID=A0ABY4W217_9PROT|nr:VOC family protein [Sneathiella marina]USG59912.1 VOC family protein [Sneathiella marina]